MKEKFAGWYSKSPEEVAALWDKAIFVPDANVLLHCVRHAAPVREELLRLFDRLKESLWIPYQVGLEFHRNRLDVELSAQDAYDALVKDQEAVIEKARDRLRQLRAHPTIDVAKELAAVEMFLTDFRARMLQLKESHPSDEIAAVVTRLTKAFDGRVGDKWKSDKLNVVRKEGEERYAKKIPPGYRDARKDGELDKFGDLIIWKDMIEKAKLDQRPVIFVSDDAKEDWWWIHRGRKLGPRPELIEEFKAESGQQFHIYEFTQFLRFAAERFPEIKAGVETVEQSLQNDERARKRLSDAEDVVSANARMRELEEERDQIVAALSGAPGLAKPLTSADKVTLKLRLVMITSELAELGQGSAAGEAVSGDGDGQGS